MCRLSWNLGASTPGTLRACPGLLQDCFTLNKKRLLGLIRTVWRLHQNNVLYGAIKQKGFMWKNSILSRNVPVSACQYVASTQEANEGHCSWSGYTEQNLNDPSCQANYTSPSWVSGTFCMYKLWRASSGGCHCLGSFRDTSPTIYGKQQVLTATCDVTHVTSFKCLKFDKLAMFRQLTLLPSSDKIQKLCNPDIGANSRQRSPFGSAYKPWTVYQFTEDKKKIFIFMIYLTMLHEPAISVSMRYVPNDQKIWVRLLVGREMFPFTDYGPHPASYPMGTAEPSLGGKKKTPWP
jgi:hypothetical protein